MSKIDWNKFWKDLYKWRDACRQYGVNFEFGDNDEDGIIKRAVQHFIEVQLK